MQKRPGRLVARRECDLAEGLKPSAGCLREERDGRSRAEGFGRRELVADLDRPNCANYGGRGRRPRSREGDALKSRKDAPGALRLPALGRTRAP